MAEKDGGIELLEKKHLGMKNPKGDPLIGWIKTSQGHGGLVNHHGWAFIRGAVWRKIVGAVGLLYDQPMIVESPGVIIVVETDDGRIGLSRTFRNVGKRIIPNADGSYVRQLDEQRLWDKLCSSLGRWVWEAPKGLAPEDLEAENLEEIILKAAKLESLQEGGFILKDAQYVSDVCASLTFTPHSQHVVYARLESTTEIRPDYSEIISGSQFFTREELKELNKSGDFEDALAMAGIFLCILHGLIEL